MIKKRFTSAANSYVTVLRRDDIEADFFVVAAAYDAGLYHGVNARKSAQKVLEELAESSDNDEH